MKQLQEPFNPFEPLTQSLLQQLVAAGRRYWILQRLRWPGLAPGTAFMATPYMDKGEAELHQSALPIKEGKLLDMASASEKIINLISEGSGYQVFLSSYKQADWEGKMRKSYEQKIRAFIRQKTNLLPKAGTVVDINFYLNFGTLYADLEYGGKKVTRPVYEVFS